jgi:AP-3 complex subunit sigma
VFVESLDKSFENVCELDLIFHFDQVHHVLSEIIQGGLVLETNINVITANGACSAPSAADRKPVRASSQNRKLSAASASPLIPTALASSLLPGQSRASAGSSNARRWLAGLGVSG